jgi:hypothetical protein
VLTRGGTGCRICCMRSARHEQAKETVYLLTHSQLSAALSARCAAPVPAHSIRTRALPGL